MIFYQWKCSRFGCTYSETYILNSESVSKIEGRNKILEQEGLFCTFNNVVENGYIGKVVMLR